MKRFISVTTAAAVALSTLFMSACSPSPEELQNRSDATDDVIEQSVNPGDYGVSRDHLKSVLMALKPETLRTLERHGVSIMLDRRLGDQEQGLFGKEMLGVFYQKDGQRSVSLWYNGVGPEGASSWSRDAYDNGATILRKLADDLDDGDIGLSGDQVSIAGSYTTTTSTGKSSTTTTSYKWKDQSDFNQNAVKNNRGILEKSLLEIQQQKVEIDPSTSFNARPAYLQSLSI